jgi:hypothetical protein
MLSGAYERMTQERNRLFDIVENLAKALG